MNVSSENHLFDPGSKVHSTAEPKNLGNAVICSTHAVKGTVQGSMLSMDAGTDEHWKMDGFTIRSFMNLHKYIFPIVESIIAMDKYKDHPFTVKWNRWKDFPPGYEDKNIKLILEWKNVSSHFNGDLMKYKEFINQCPDIKKYISLTPNVRNEIKLDLEIKMTPEDKHPKNAKIRPSAEGTVTVTDDSKKTDVEDLANKSLSHEEETTSYIDVALTQPSIGTRNSLVTVSTADESLWNFDYVFEKDRDLDSVTNGDLSVCNPMLMNMDYLMQSLITTTSFDTKARYYNIWRQWTNPERMITKDSFREFFITLKLAMPNIHYI
jgi:hypothetical protein